MRVSRGDIVLVDYPFSDRTGSKVRPALVVQADHLNHRITDTIQPPSADLSIELLRNNCLSIFRHPKAVKPDCGKIR
jgi:hypothetical protein